MPVLEAKKLWTPTLQAASDRSQSEQYSLLVAVTHSDMRMKQWQTFAGRINPLLTTFTDKLSEHCVSSVQRVQTETDALLGLSTSLSQAEQVRVALPGSSALVSPLEALSRGFLGEEVADLTNRVRVSVHDVSRLSGSLQTIQKQMMADITAEVATLVKCGDAINELSILSL
jgi:hypothetical protein